MDWTRKELSVLRRLNTPERVQRYLDDTPYNPESVYRCPRTVLGDRKAHCFDGALLAAAALRLQGHPPLLVDLRAVRDDDHVLTIYKRRGRWGAVAKSNCVGLRFREPIYLSLRELVMSYFDSYYNLKGERTLRSYSLPVNLKRFDRFQWMFSDTHLDRVADALDAAKHPPLMTPAMVKALSKMDERSFKAGLLGANQAGLYKP